MMLRILLATAATHLSMNWGFYCKHYARTCLWRLLIMSSECMNLRSKRQIFSDVSDRHDMEHWAEYLNRLVQRAVRRLTHGSPYIPIASASN